MAFDPLTIGMLAVLAVLVFFMFRNSRKRQRDAATLQQKVQVGADVMTNFGVFGTILDIDEEDNKVTLETSPGTVLTVHRQVITRVIDDHDTDGDAATESVLAAEVDGADASLTEPAYGERLEESHDASATEVSPTTPGVSGAKTNKIDE